VSLMSRVRPVKAPKRQNVRTSKRRAVLASWRLSALACNVALTVSCIHGLTAAAEPVAPIGRADITEKGSLLLFSHVEVKWDAAGRVQQDTFLEISNDFPEDVYVQLYFVNGDAPVDAICLPDCILAYGERCVEIEACIAERAHPGWNWVDVQVLLTANQPVYWSAATGEALGVSSFAILDPGPPVGRPDPDPDHRGGRVVRGYVLAWAVNHDGHEIRWNHLSGAALVLDYKLSAAWEYRAWSFQADSAAHGEEPASCRVFNLDTGRCMDSMVVPGRLDLDGYEYASCPGRLTFQFRTAGSTLDAPGSQGMYGGPDVAVDTSLTLALCGSDLRQETNGPITTKAKFDIWNENEIRFSGTERCVTCWDSALLKSYTTLGIPNHFLLSNLHTRTGRARVDGVESVVCHDSIGAAMLGVVHELLRFPFNGKDEWIMLDRTTRIEKAGVELTGQGDEVAQILYDIVEPPQEASHGR